MSTRSAPELRPAKVKPGPLSRPWIALLLALALFLAPPFTRAGAEEADFSGLAPFWAIAEMVASGREPPNSAWATLFATPGYRTLKERENADSFLARLLPLALSPGQESSAREAIETPPWQEVFVTHLRSAFAHREQLATFRKELQQRPLLEEALIEAQRWLPEGSSAGFGIPAVSFVIYQPDARGYDRIIMDLMLAFEQQELFEGILAHETHHVIRSALQGSWNWGERPEANLLTALDNLQAEGIADLIDKPAQLSIDNWGDRSTDQAFKQLGDRFREELARMQQRLAAVDRLLAEYAGQPSAAPELGNRLRETLVMGGHPVGYHMASVIVSAGGRHRMIENVADPFDFIRAYNEAAAADSGQRHIFSEKALQGLAMLEALRPR